MALFSYICENISDQYTHFGTNVKYAGNYGNFYSVLYFEVI